MSGVRYDGIVLVFATHTFSYDSVLHSMSRILAANLMDDSY